MGATSLFFPIGYFLPILFSKMLKIKNVILTSIVPGLFVGVYVSMRAKEVMPIKELFIVICIIGSIFGSALGYHSLVGINKLVWLGKSLFSKLIATVR